MEPEVIIGLDLGSSSVKAVAYDRSGRPQEESRLPTPLLTTSAGTDFPLPELLAGAREVVRGVRRGRRVAAVGLTSMGEIGGVLTDDGGLATPSFPAWYDERGHEVVERVRAGSAIPLDGRTGGHLRTTSSLAKLGWLVDRGAETPGTFLGLCSLLAHGWTGHAWAEASLAATSGAFDPLAGQWLDEPWRLAGLRGLRRPPVARPGHGAPALGERARADGITDAVIVIAGHDHLVAAVGTGARPGSVVDSMGTGEPVLATWARRSPDPRQVDDLVADGFTVESWPATGDPVLIWEGLRPGLAMSTFCELTATPREELEAAAAHAASLEADPWSRADCLALEAGRAEPLGQRGLLGGSPEAILDGWRGLLAGYAQQAREGERAVRAATGAPGPVVLTGGGVRSTGWVAAKRALVDHPLVVSTLADSGARGAAAIAGATLGWWPSADRMS